MVGIETVRLAIYKRLTIKWLVGSYRTVPIALGRPYARSSQRVRKSLITNDIFLVSYGPIILNLFQILNDPTPAPRTTPPRHPELDSGSVFRVPRFRIVSGMNYGCSKWTSSMLTPWPFIVVISSWDTFLAATTMKSPRGEQNIFVNNWLSTGRCSPILKIRQCEQLMLTNILIIKHMRNASCLPYRSGTHQHNRLRITLPPGKYRSRRMTFFNTVPMFVTQIKMEWASQKLMRSALRGSDPCR